MEKPNNSDEPTKPTPSDHDAISAIPLPVNTITTSQQQQQQHRIQPAATTTSQQQQNHHRTQPPASITTRPIQSSQGVNMDPSQPKPLESTTSSMMIRNIASIPLPSQPPPPSTTPSGPILLSSTSQRTVAAMLHTPSPAKATTTTIFGPILSSQKTGAATTSALHTPSSATMDATDATQSQNKPQAAMPTITTEPKLKLATKATIPCQVKMSSTSTGSLVQPQLLGKELMERSLNKPITATQNKPDNIIPSLTTSDNVNLVSGIAKLTPNTEGLSSLVSYSSSSSSEPSPSDQHDDDEDDSNLLLSALCDEPLPDTLPLMMINEPNIQSGGGDKITSVPLQTEQTTPQQTVNVIPVPSTQTCTQKVITTTPSKPLTETMKILLDQSVKMMTVPPVKSLNVRQSNPVPPMNTTTPVTTIQPPVQTLQQGQVIKMTKDQSEVTKLPIIKTTEVVKVIKMQPTQVTKIINPEAVEGTKVTTVVTKASSSSSNNDPPMESTKQSTSCQPMMNIIKTTQPITHASNIKLMGEVTKNITLPQQIKVTKTSPVFDQSNKSKESIVDDTSDKIQGKLETKHQQITHENITGGAMDSKVTTVKQPTELKPLKDHIISHSESQEGINKDDNAKDSNKNNDNNPQHQPSTSTTTTITSDDNKCTSVPSVAVVIEGRVEEKLKKNIDKLDEEHVKKKDDKIEERVKKDIIDKAVNNPGTLSEQNILKKPQSKQTILTNVKEMMKEITTTTTSSKVVQEQAAGVGNNDNDDNISGSIEDALCEMGMALSPPPGVVVLSQLQRQERERKMEGNTEQRKTQVPSMKVQEGNSEQRKTQQVPTMKVQERNSEQRKTQQLPPMIMKVQEGNSEQKKTQQLPIIMKVQEGNSEQRKTQPLPPIIMNVEGKSKIEDVNMKGKREMEDKMMSGKRKAEEEMLITDKRKMEDDAMNVEAKRKKMEEERNVEGKKMEEERNVERKMVEDRKMEEERNVERKKMEENKNTERKKMEEDRNAERKKMEEDTNAERKKMEEERNVEVKKMGSEDVSRESSSESDEQDENMKRKRPRLENTQTDSLTQPTTTTTTTAAAERERGKEQTGEEEEEEDDDDDDDEDEEEEDDDDERKMESEVKVAVRQGRGRGRGRGGRGRKFMRRKHKPRINKNDDESRDGIMEEEEEEGGREEEDQNKDKDQDGKDDDDGSTPSRRRRKKKKCYERPRGEGGKFMKEKPDPSMMDEETRMEYSMIQDEDSQGSASKREVRRFRCEVIVPESTEVFTADKVVEYVWPLEGISEHYFIQEQISQYLGIMSFKRRYPDLRRRPIDMQERDYLKEKGLVSEIACDLGLTAVRSEDVLDVMFNDFPGKFEELQRLLREKKENEIRERGKVNYSLANIDKSKMQEYGRKAAADAARWNSNFNKEKRDERRYSFDLQTFTLQMPHGRRKRLSAECTKIGWYPVSVLPGQYTDYYREYSPQTLKTFPLTSVLATPVLQDTLGSDAASSDSEDEGTLRSVKDSVSEPTTKEEKPSLDTASPRCKVCSGTKNRNKGGKPEPLIICGNCRSASHPTCIDLTLVMVPKIESYNWQCMDCKTCVTCSNPDDEDKMIFCDMCDRGYHIFCVGLRKVPNGRWHCKECAMCSSCGSKTPAGNEHIKNAEWQHEFKKDKDNKQLRYATTLCVPCDKYWKRRQFCYVCLKVYRSIPEDGMVRCSNCPKYIHREVCSTMYENERFCINCFKMRNSTALNHSRIIAAAKKKMASGY